MIVPSPKVRGIAKAIRGLAWISAAATLPFAIIVLMCLMANVDIGGLLRRLRFFFRSLYSGHAMRPFVLRTVSRGKTTLPSIRETGRIH